jgi:hypothetical protein
MRYLSMKIAIVAAVAIILLSSIPHAAPQPQAGAQQCVAASAVNRSAASRRNIRLVSSTRVVHGISSAVNRQ